MTQLSGYTPALHIEIIGDRESVKTHDRVNAIREKGLHVYHAAGPKADSCDLTFVPDCMTVLSPVDGRAKFSIGYAQCFGVVVLGQDKKTSKMLSLLVHGNPDCFMQKKDMFRQALQEKLNTLVESCCACSIRGHIFAGETRPHWRAEERRYRGRVDFLSKTIYEATGHIPVVLLPKFERPFHSEFYLETQTREAFLVQPLPTKISINSMFSANKVCCEQLRWSIAARKRYGQPLMGCYPFVEW